MSEWILWVQPSTKPNKHGGARPWLWRGVGQAASAFTSEQVWYVHTDLSALPAWLLQSVLIAVVDTNCQWWHTMPFRWNPGNRRWTLWPESAVTANDLSPRRVFIHGTTPCSLRQWPQYKSNLSLNDNGEPLSTKMSMATPRSRTELTTLTLLMSALWKRFGQWVCLCYVESQTEPQHLWWLNRIIVMRKLTLLWTTASVLLNISKQELSCC